MLYLEDSLWDDARLVSRRPFYADTWLESCARTSDTRVPWLSVHSKVCDDHEPRIQSASVTRQRRVMWRETSLGPFLGDPRQRSTSHCGRTIRSRSIPRRSILAALHTAVERIGFADAYWIEFWILFDCLKGHRFSKCSAAPNVSTTHISKPNK